MSCCFFFGTLRGLLLLFWRVLCLFGTVLIGVPVGFPLGACLLTFTDESEGVGVVRVEHFAPAVMPGFSGGGWS